MAQTLRDESRFRVAIYAEEPLPAEAARYDAVVSFDLQNCGFRLVNRKSEQLSAFFEFEARARLEGDQEIWDDREVMLGQHRFSLDELTASPGPALEDLAEASRQAGASMAFLMIYP
ncbi:MAG: hypothetical protein QNK04_23275 [Myxococcota bacterium]|nr:hypothetical protein [Myxococcota bacterium]